MHPTPGTGWGQARGLARQDSNLNKGNQNPLCYRYTTGQCHHYRNLGAICQSFPRFASFSLPAYTLCEMASKGGHKKNLPRAAPGPAVEERRKHARFPLTECTLTLFPTSAKENNLAHAIVDVSEGGICVRTSEPLEEGTPVRLHLVLSKFADQIQAAGTVRWCRPPLEGGGNYAVGIMFTELSPADAEKLANMKNWFTAPFLRRPSRK